MTPYNARWIMMESDNFRPMRRFRQQLPDDVCETILTKAYRGYLSVNGDGGYPYTTPVNFVYENGHVYFHSALQGHKIDALRACPKACFTVIDEPVKEDNDWWYHVRSVICFGKVNFIDDESRKTAWLMRLGKKYFPEDYDINGDLRKNGPRTIVLDFEIEHMTGKQVKEQ